MTEPGNQRPASRAAPTLLHIDASARATGSESRRLSSDFVAGWRNLYPAAKVITRDIVTAPLPHLDQALLSGLQTGSDERSPAQAAAVARVDELVAEFLAADCIVLGVPMYNFGIPSTLKAWIDHIAIAGRTFRYGAQGPVGLAGGRTVYLCSARGGVFGEGPMDHQVSYLRTLFGFLGIDDLRVIQAEGLNRDSTKEQGLRAAERAMAGVFAAIRAAA